MGGIGQSEDRLSREYLQTHLIAGKSTKQDVRSLFGEPRYKSEGSDKRDYWSYSEDQVNGNIFSKAINYLPSLGTVGDAAVDSQKSKAERDLSIFFKANGVVDSYDVAGTTGARR